MSDRRRAWAAALFSAAPDAEARRAYGEALGLLAAIYEGRLDSILRDPAIEKGAKASLLALALEREDGSFVPGAAVFGRFCRLLVDKGRTALLRGIAGAYRDRLDAAEGISRLEVEAAREPAPGLLDRLGEAWLKSIGPSAEASRAASSTGASAAASAPRPIPRRAIVSLRFNPALVAGYRLRAGSIRVDYSVAGRLERLRRELTRPMGSGKDDSNAATTR